MSSTAIKYLQGTTPSVVVPITDGKNKPLDLSGESSLEFIVLRRLYDQEIPVDTQVLSPSYSWAVGEVVVSPPVILTSDKPYIYKIMTSAGVCLLSSTILASTNPAAIKDCCAQIGEVKPSSTADVQIGDEDGLFDTAACCTFKELDLSSPTGTAYLKYTKYSTDYLRNSLSFETPVLPLANSISRSIAANLKTDATSYHFSVSLDMTTTGDVAYDSITKISLAKISEASYPTVSPWAVELVRKFNNRPEAPAADQVTVRVLCDGAEVESYVTSGANSARVYISVDYAAKVIAVKTAAHSTVHAFTTQFFGQDVTISQSLTANGGATCSVKDTVTVVAPTLPWEDQAGFLNTPLGISYGNFLPVIGSRYWVSAPGTFNGIPYIAPDMHGNAEAFLVIQKYPLKVTKIGRYSAGTADDIVIGGDGLAEDRSTPGEVTLNVVNRVETVTGTGRISVDNADPLNPVVTYTGGTGGPGEYLVETIISSGQTDFILSTISAEYALVFIGGVFTPTGFTVDIPNNKIVFASTVPSGIEVNFLEVSKGNAVNGVPVGGTTGQLLMKDTTEPKGYKWATYSPPAVAYPNAYHGMGIQVDRQGNLVPNTPNGKGYLSFGSGLVEVSNTLAEGLNSIPAGVVHVLAYRAFPTTAIVATTDSVVVSNGVLYTSMMGMPVLGLVCKVPSTLGNTWAPTNSLVVRNLFNDTGTLINPVQPVSPAGQSIPTVSTYVSPGNKGTTRVYAQTSIAEYAVPTSEGVHGATPIAATLPILCFEAERLKFRVDALARVLVSFAGVQTRVIAATPTSSILMAHTTRNGNDVRVNVVTPATGTMLQTLSATGIADMGSNSLLMVNPSFLTLAAGQAVVYTGSVYTEVFHSGSHRYSAFVRK